MNSPRGWVAHCPAKINLLLRVRSRRSDGHHEIETVFQAIDLWDRLEIRPGPDLVLECDAAGVPLDGSNLVLRAAGLLRSRHGGSAGATFRLHKAIPVQGGLGGGSSDAAAALRLARRLWGLEIEDRQLVALAAELGADVAFFLRGGTAFGLGRGERLADCPPCRPLDLLLGTPPFGVPTAEAYGGLGAVLTLSRNGVSLPVFLAHKWPQENDFGLMANDLEAVVFARWPELERFRDAVLAGGARRALLCGSGSSVYGIFDDAQDAGAAITGLRSRFPGWRLRVTRTIAEGIRIDPLAGGPGP